METQKKKKVIKALLILTITLALVLQIIYWPKHEEWEDPFPKQIFNALKNI